MSKVIGINQENGQFLTTVYPKAVFLR